SLHSTYCRAWLPRARMHLFHALRLDSHVALRKTRALLCDPTSTVLPYVRHFHLLEGRSGRLHTRPPWLDNTLPCMRFQDLTALRCLELSNVWWQALSRESRACLRAACQPIRCLILWDLQLTDALRPVFDIISAAPLLEHLEVLSAGYPRKDDRLTIASLRSLPSHKWRMPDTLSSLDIESELSGFFVALGHFTPELHVRTLSVKFVDREHASNVAAFVQSCGSSPMEHVNVSFADSPDPDSAPSAADIFCNSGGFSKNTSLCTLQLDVNAVSVVPILRSISSTTMKKGLFGITPQTLCMLDLDGLASLLRTGPLESTRIEIIGFESFDAEIRPLIDARDTLYRRLDSLRAEGRLEFTRAGGYSMEVSAPRGFYASFALRFPDLSLPYK
ncbi:uncharacterized protein B0H18DRAFT_983022, partial [Fomitopsis serialis]|uniref:uncharacterized protein n=1 Tax=Fomitopsis serialis TaxID=139415 RepID=UPI0020081DE0